MEDYTTKLIVVGVVSWSSTFLVARRIFPKRSFDFCNRVVSTIHAILAVTLASLSVEDWRCPICPVASKSSQKEVLYCVCFEGNLNIAMDLVCVNCLVLTLRVECLKLWSDASSGSEPFLSHLWSSVLSLWWKSQLGQHHPPFGKHCWTWSRSLLSKGDYPLKYNIFSL